MTLLIYGIINRMGKTGRKRLTHEVYFNTGSEVLRAKGASMYGALSKLEPKKPFKKYGKVTVVVNGKESQIPRQVNIYKMQRLFKNPWEMEIFAKNLETLR